ncbi:LysE family translocator [Oceanospirillum beijerinckii]|uniref:LysE family translocator n=1 Tax=Oceanospirillum beijerinckii TaxID=64976 RepID=UPI0004063C53|nr:LysE family translocator [Oceanospirillum beijerinckii]
MDPFIWLTFAAAALGLSVTPGPNGLLALTHGAMHGKRLALFTISGGVLGFMMLFAVTVAGLGVMLQASPTALTLLKVIGAFYLIWLGVQLWQAPALKLDMVEQSGNLSAYRLFRQGMLVALSNPKVILFLGVFLAMFIDTERPLIPQFMLMALTFAVTEFAVEYLLAALAVKARPWLIRKGKGFNRCCGVLFMALGVVLPFSQ